MVFIKHSCGLFGVVLFLFATCASAQNIAITNAEIYSLEDNSISKGTLTKGTLTKGTLLVQDGKIAAIGNTEIPNGVKTIDAKGGSITPGIFNAHTYIGIEEVSLIPQTVDKITLNPRITASLKVADAFNFRSVTIAHNRSQGVTHAIVFPQSGTGIIAGQAALVNLSGKADSVIEEYLALVVTLGEGGQHIAGGSRAAAMLQLREAFEDARDFVNNQSQFNQGQRRAYALSRLDLEAIAQVIQNKKPMIVYVNRAADILNVLEFAKQQNISVILAGAHEAWLVADNIAEANVPVIIDPILNLPFQYEALAASEDNAKILDKAGVDLLFTGKNWLNTHNAFLVRQSAGNAVANGLDKFAALRAITVNPAKVFAGVNIPSQIKVGEQANFVVWSGDPLEVTSEPLLVMLEGEQASLETRSELLTKRYMERIEAQIKQ